MLPPDIRVVYVGFSSLAMMQTEGVASTISGGFSVNFAKRAPTPREDGTFSACEIVVHTHRAGLLIDGCFRLHHR